MSRLDKWNDFTVDDANSDLGLASRQLAFALKSASTKDLHTAADSLQKALFVYGRAIVERVSEEQ